MPQHVVRAEPDEIRLVDMGRLIMRKWRTVAVCAVIGAVTAVLIALSMTNIFRAETVLAPASDETGGGGGKGGAFASVAELAGVRMPGSTGVTKADEAIAVLRSRRFTEDFIKAENLLPVLFAEKPPTLLSRVFGGIFGGADDAEPVQSGDPDKVMWEAIKSFNAIRNVIIDSKTGIVTLTIEWTDPAVAADWANKLVVYINSESRVREINSAQSNLSYLQSQVDSTTSIEMRRLLFNLIEGETRRIMLANSRDEFSFRIIDPAVVPQDRARPKRAIISVVGLFAGIALGVFVVLFMNAIRDEDVRPRPAA